MGSAGVDLVESIIANVLWQNPSTVGEQAHQIVRCLVDRGYEIRAVQKGPYLIFCSTCSEVAAEGFRCACLRQGKRPSLVIDPSSGTKRDGNG